MNYCENSVGMKEISVIIPVFNTVIDDLEMCIDSILRQSFEKFEIIVVDDGSAKECAMNYDLMKEKDERIFVLHKMNEGVSAARNYGVEYASGEYIMFVDGDDLLTPWALEEGYNLIKETNSDVVIGRSFQVDERPTKILYQKNSSQYDVIHSKEDIEEFKAQILIKHVRNWGRNEHNYIINGEGCWAHLLKKTVAVRIPFCEGIAIGEDTIWAIQMLENIEGIRLCIADSLWYYYIQNKDSVLHRFNPSFSDEIEKAVAILNLTFLHSTISLYHAYIEWIQYKIKQIIYCYYLSEKCELSKIERMQKFKQLMKKRPWREIIKYSLKVNIKINIKFWAYRSGMIILLYGLKSKTSDGQHLKEETV